jgi:hypothetical protein
VLPPTSEISFIFKAEFVTNLPYFDFDSDMEPWTAAKAFAKEPWSKEYFDNVKKYVYNCYHTLLRY